MSNKFIKFLIIPALILLLTAGYLIYQGSQKQSQISSSKVLDQNQRPDYLIVLLGDSMTQALGNSDELREYMAQYYPGRTFDFLNYGFGSTNILSVEKRLTEWTFYGRDFQPIMDIDFDLILIESFGFFRTEKHGIGVAQRSQQPFNRPIKQDIVFYRLSYLFFDRNRKQLYNTGFI